MNAQGHWELRDTVCRGFSNCKWTGGSTKRIGKLSAAFEIADHKCPLSLQSNEVHSLVGNSLVGNSFLNCQQLLKWRGIFKGLSQDGGWADFSKNLPASLFNKSLSNGPIFGRLLLTGQSVPCTFQHYLTVSGCQSCNDIQHDCCSVLRLSGKNVEQKINN
jgi:hypothetical protein